MCPYGDKCRCACSRCHDSKTIFSGGRVVKCPACG